MKKLVRDRIPEMTGEQGRKLKFTKIPKAKFKRALAAKLVEEAKEYQESLKVEELADVLEVLLALLKETKVSWSQLTKVRLKKLKERGAFRARIGINR